MHHTDALIIALRTVFPSITVSPEAERGWHAAIALAAEQIPGAASLLFEHGLALSFITAVHVRPRCELVYHFVRWEDAFRIVLHLPVPENNTVPSIAEIYHGAAWHEREIGEFFGIVFSNHPGLKPLLLTREEKGLCPLLRSDSLLQSRENVLIW
ncbi:MAG: NADH-quinone oxidoreductase subunit C [Desulfobacterota bacterium]|nr:NADH-quinone oxidoreductase subunit C [Thermodesulfobacteriota bacterium]